MELSWAQVNKRILVIFILVHLITLYLVLTVPFKVEYLYFAIGMFYLRWAVLSCFFHRYFAHRVCKTSRFFQFLMGLFGTLSMVRGPLTFASGHRLHHHKADTEGDLHSIHQQSVFYSYLGWVINKGYDENTIGRINDLKKYPELCYLTRFYYTPNLILLYVIYHFFGLGVMTWAGLVSIIFNWHIAFSTTILFHVVGGRDYDTKDKSRNSFLLNLLTLGEGWHNNHHHNMSSARIGHKWWQIDPGFWLFWVFEKLGLVWKLNKTTSQPKGNTTKRTQPHSINRSTQNIFSS